MIELSMHLHRREEPSIKAALAGIAKTATAPSAPNCQPLLPPKNVHQNQTCRMHRSRPTIAYLATAALPTIAAIVPSDPSTEEHPRTPFTPEEDAQLVNHLCDPMAIKRARRQIKHLKSDILSVRASFDAVIRNIECLHDLHTLERFHLREATRELPKLRDLLKRFNDEVEASREEAASAAAVLISYQSTVLDAVHERQSIDALKGEIEILAEAIAEHDARAATIGINFNRLSLAVRQVAMVITQCVQKNEDKQHHIQRKVLEDLKRKASELGDTVEKCDQARLVFLQALLGVGQHCAGLAVAAFGGDDLLFHGNNSKGDGGFHKIWDYISGLQKPKPISTTVVQDSTAQDEFLLNADAVRLGKGATKIGAVGGLWTVLHLDLHKVNEWLSMKFVGGEYQGNLELYKLSADSMRDLTRDLIEQLVDYSNNTP